MQMTLQELSDAGNFILFHRLDGEHRSLDLERGMPPMEYTEGCATGDGYSSTTSTYTWPATNALPQLSVQTCDGHTTTTRELELYSVELRSYCRSDILVASWKITTSNTTGHQVQATG